MFAYPPLRARTLGCLVDNSGLKTIGMVRLEPDPPPAVNVKPSLSGTTYVHYLARLAYET